MMLQPSRVALRAAQAKAGISTSMSRSATRAFSTSLVQNKDVQNITVFGAGLMGAGIAQVLAHKGKFNVTLSDVTDKALANGQTIISKSLGRIVKKSMAEASAEEQAQYVKGIVDSIKVTTDPEAAVKDTDLVIEAIIENVGIKKDLFGFLDGKAPKDALFASNTSSLSITDVAEAVSAQRQELFGGFHAFNPVPQMKLVEVVRTTKTSNDTFDSLTEVAKRMGKTPVACIDSPGFIVNRLLVPYMLEAIRLVERGEATAKDVDIAMKLGAGYPMGPFELADLVGLDTLSHIAKGWRETRVKTGEINADAVSESKLLEDLVKQGKLGKKSGEKGGFYEYPAPPKK
ncbi:putative short chain 3-hydroxyacyl-CoA dehydrogenase [Mycosarcoma maydis]|uniref:3-hydroxyacyl-CoA dehydrogenase n=1 Tax=Mycosarcoma maydis TaxID=5270 RepID=A0A0D1E6I3_MYCMD|nr:putative short chain 3-hydroxyacyl-CoA dehydrogenase [Ustilago maydis 521]KIS71191.1 putative short chain 3-hydroxyacyl-CoA dehydrogenase [Ustilago maydis 521]|eukprot:XP_011387056.1 putative short chain 3-hydroxyacyl-CoA dehydrogenase [Ustilago maydis 521]